MGEENRENENTSVNESPDLTADNLSQQMIDKELAESAADTGTEPTPSPATLASQIYPTPTEPGPTPVPDLTAAATPDDKKHTGLTEHHATHKARRFLIAYMTAVFSAITILYGTAWLGYVLFNHFLGPKQEDSGLFYFDLAPVYISIMATLIVFAITYIIASRYVAKSVSDDTIALKDWRAYKVVYAVFAAILIVTGASVIASLLYIPLAQTMLASDIQSKQILVQTLTGVYVLLWIGLLILQERLVKKSKQSWVQSFVVVAAVAVVVIATGIFPVGSKTDERYDHRAESDLSSLETKINTYKTDNQNKLPTTLSDLKFEDDSPLKGRINDYKYTIKSTPSGSSYDATMNSIDATVGSSDMSNSSPAYQALIGKSAKQSSPVQSSSSYELCATFRTDTTNKDNNSASPLISALNGSTSSSDSFTRHKTGEVCFARNSGSSLY